MPQLPASIGDDPYAFHTYDPIEPYPPRQCRWKHLSLNKIGNWLKKDGRGTHSDPLDYQQFQKQHHNAPDLACNTWISKKAVPALRRPQTFGGQLSEQRDKLCPSHACEHKQRAVSLDRKRGIRRQGVALSGLSPGPSNSTLGIKHARNEVGTSSQKDEPKPGSEYGVVGVDVYNDEPEGERPPIIPAPFSTTEPLTDPDNLSEPEDEQKLREELEAKWILNLSMHFRDRSEREKFFVTYAEEPNRWRRVTVSCDYRNVPPDSLEQDLRTLHYQRDKNARIYEAIRDSLKAIEFYDTVTNLNLQTTDRQLHVHVTEDVNEIIPYPPITAVAHIHCKMYPESALVFESHLSGFVYKVRLDGQIYIKKEIPSPDNVDEFLYELNALYDLRNSRGVIPYVGIVVDDRQRIVKGLLISFASQGALVDIIYDEPDLPWMCRERWARQIVHGLSEIHEGGFVQGDFTLSNIVVDAKNDAKLIDINRRGCPMGWEPPEMMAMIDSGQRISMYIGVKSDIFQLGMVLWALAIMKDEPERQERPIVNLQCWCDADIPIYYRDLVKTCLSDTPQSRLSAKELLRFFPTAGDEDFQPHIDRPARVGHRADIEYIDPADEVSRDDIERYQQRQSAAERSHVSTDGTTYVEALSSPRYLFDSSGSYIVGQRRSPVGTSRTEPARRASLESLRGAEATSEGPSGPLLRDGQWEHLGAETFLRANHRSQQISATDGSQV